jgi:hypothetical protein
MQDFLLSQKSPSRTARHLPGIAWLKPHDYEPNTSDRCFMCHGGNDCYRGVLNTWCFR